MMAEQNSNRFDMDFARRLGAASFAGAIGLFAFVVLLGMPILLLFGMAAGSIVLSLMSCVIIGLAADYMNLFPFPLRAAWTETASDEDIATLMLRAAALPLSFASAVLWLVMLSAALGAEAYGLGLLLITPVTIVLAIIHGDAATPREAFSQSLKTFALIAITAVLIMPGLMPHEAVDMGFEATPVPDL